MAAVGDGWCVCTGRGVWSLFVVRSLFLGHCGHLWPFVFVGVIVGGRRRSQCGRSLLVVVCLDGGGKEKSKHITLPNRHCLLSTTNK